MAVVIQCHRNCVENICVLDSPAPGNPGYPLLKTRSSMDFLEITSFILIGFVLISNKEVCQLLS